MHDNSINELLFVSQKSSGKDSFRKEVLMVDPLEAKKLAAKQLAEIKSKENFKVCDFHCLYFISSIKWCRISFCSSETIKVPRNICMFILN